VADNELVVQIAAKTDEFVKKVQDAQTKVRSLASQMSEIYKHLKTESVDCVQKDEPKIRISSTSL